MAIIGAGPAGLTAASDLVRRGFSVTVFEALPLAGGMMRFGIPEYRLRRKCSISTSNTSRAWALAFNSMPPLGRDFTLADLREQGYQAVLLATGAHGSRGLKVAGADLPGIEQRHCLAARGEAGRNAGHRQAGGGHRWRRRRDGYRTHGAAAGCGERRPLLPGSP